MNYEIPEFLTDEQRKVVQHIDGPAMVVASPGSGKTACITHRCAHMLNRGIDPKTIVAITFTNKAAEEMKTRVRKLVGSRASQLQISTFHSFCARLLRERPDRYGVAPNFNICDAGDSKQYCSQALARVSGKAVKDVKKFQGYRSVGYCCRRISEWKGKMLSPQDVAPRDQREKFLVQVYREYNQILHHFRSLDFDDLIYRTVTTLQRDQDLQQLYSDRYHYLMVDEYQDTDPSQFELVWLLGKYTKNVVVVGDEDQSIYRFRGAEPANVRAFVEKFDADVYKLQYNFRSLPGITEAANVLIDQNDRFTEKTIKATKEGDAVPMVLRFDDARHQANWLLSNIEGMVKSGKAKWRDYCVQYRIRSCSRALEEVAVRKGMPFRVVGSLGFYQRRTVKDILAYCRLVHNVGDDAAFTRIYNQPRRGFGEASFGNLCAATHEAGLSLLGGLDAGVGDQVLKGSAREGAGQIARLMLMLRGLDQAKIGPIVEAAVEHSGYRRYVENLPEGVAEDKIEQLDELSSAAYQFDNDIGTGLAGFLEHVALVQDRKADKDQNVVTLMTCHAAKGTEFPHVAVVDVVDGICPLIARNDDPFDPLDAKREKEHYEEERRVFFVAITRAERSLVICHPARNQYRGQWRDCTPSRFLDELGETVQHRDLSRPPRFDYGRQGYQGGYGNKRW